MKRGAPLKRTPLKIKPESVKAWQERTQATLRVASAGGEGQRSTKARRATALEYAAANGDLNAARRVARGDIGFKQPRWWMGEIRGTLCVVCGKRKAVAGHHVIRLQTLRREAVRLGYDFKVVAYARANRLPVCRSCHDNHHARSRPISREVLLRAAPRVFEFAASLGLSHILDREYVASER